MTSFPLISVVVITFKRLELLRRTITSFLKVTHYPNLELILCDDGSPKSIQEEMKKLPFDKFLFSKKNQGLGANTNKGIREAKGKYILQLQDDWECIGPSDFLELSIQLFNNRSDIGLIRFYDVSYLKYYEKYLYGNKSIKIFDNDQRGIKNGIFVYSDTPHIKRKRLHEELGLYAEHIPMDKTEIDFCKRFIFGNKYKAAYIDGYDVFKHLGERQSFNPNAKKARIKKMLSSNILTRIPMNTFLRIKRYLVRYLK